MSARVPGCRKNSGSMHAQRGRDPGPGGAAVAGGLDEGQLAALEFGGQAADIEARAAAASCGPLPRAALMMPAMASPGLSGQAVSAAGGRLLMARAAGGPCAGLR